MHSSERKTWAGPHCFTGETTRLIGQSALEDLVDPGWSRRGVAVVVLGVQCAVGKTTV